MPAMKLQPIKTEEQYLAALGRIEKIFWAKPGTSEGEELDRLVDLVEEYEDRVHPIGPPKPFLESDSVNG